MTETLRKPVVAGRFYPGRPDALRRQVEEFIGTSEEEHDLLACVAPHAGYVYSGRVAGKVFSELRIPNRVLVLGPNHTGIGNAVAVAPHEGWETPLGTTTIDSEMNKILLDEVPGAELDASAHWREHSIEVQLPFLQVRQPQLKVTAICLTHLSLDDCRKAGQGIARAVSRLDEPVGLVASSDMTHYEPDEVARERDRKAIDAALTMDPAALYDTVHELGITMCGVIPTTVAMVAARELGGTTAHLVAYETSGDTSGDRSAVVGYAGIRFSREPT
jgi:AmmeMemoRadiSam system protein B